MTVREITPETEGLLRSGYVTRQEGELAVLSRWFPAEAVGTLAIAPYLDVILYSREQIRKENEVRIMVPLSSDACRIHGFPNFAVLTRRWARRPSQTHRGGL